MAEVMTAEEIIERLRDAAKLCREEAAWVHATEGYALRCVTNAEAIEQAIPLLTAAARVEALEQENATLRRLLNATAGYVQDAAEDGSESGAELYPEVAEALTGGQPHEQG